ncbi:General substrate transporter [Trichormus variabilis ATCC 29413]|uniref:General substrate transporter n=2 Tax=Anabaena variabilis TaxID=264691 RepID=Q3M7N1_TRIV2|nr:MULTISPECIES: MFS transporter [Nostocaceae]ABA23005.1 General substrate transporter [Trichormus variabilis ATCC 29413]MBC1215311.1 MFS transporter [Trichormus variabilis ARAD]MBC1256293.1 MFS transporter [Trichormus variabilis V5]MBC1268538.1 MFS transporter [Trichormus variabilis FSR]MBC1303976.1 MFS transporter [Trichormus variabilis N2B]
MKAFNTFDASLRLNLLILFTAGLLFWSSTATFLPTLPLYIEDVGGSKQEIGIVMGGFAIGLLVFRPMLGRMADQNGRKLLLLIGTIVATIAPFGYLAFKSIPLLMLVRVFHGISIAAFTTGYSALIADLAPIAIRGEIISYMSLTAPIGLAIGPALGGYLQASIGYPILFLIASELAFVGLLGTIQVSNPPVPQGRQATEKDSNFWQLLSSPRVRVPTLVMLLIGIAIGAVHIFLPLFIKSTGVEFNAGLFFTIAAIGSFSLRVFAGKASDRFGRGLFITFGIMAYMLSSFLLWQANSAISFAIAAIAEGCGGGTMISMITTMMADRSLPQERGRIFSICIAGLDLGIAIAAPILGFIAEATGYRSMFAYTTALTFLALLIFLTRSSKNLSNSLRFALGRGQDVYSLHNSN